ncbi:MAG: hypothetical protein EAZ60_12990 [Oscillatoriales cyanobacterium]|nr:MAG: hypothetical protein EAZ83_21020 [Oscillatoriales cyanobacterium]TAF17165.1 MAG: hypothetical protein EAZ73_22480 [Oscillatoriales cyanobacterium]TAF55510.1 MAG: hypothetical protein EAZ60_12990 [Oscillatoriales cyanobacterium]
MQINRRRCYFGTTRNNPYSKNSEIGSQEKTQGTDRMRTKVLTTNSFVGCALRTLPLPIAEQTIFLNEVEYQQKLLKELCKSTEEDVILEQPEVIATPKTRKSAAKKKRKETIE